MEIFPSSFRERTRNLYSCENLRCLCNAGDRILPNLIKNTLIEKCRPGYRKNSKDKKNKNKNTRRTKTHVSMVEVQAVEKLWKLEQG